MMLFLDIYEKIHQLTQGYRITNWKGMLYFTVSLRPDVAMRVEKTGKTGQYKAAVFS